MVSTLSAHEIRKETHYFIKLYSAVLKYCAIALQAAVEDKLRMNTIKQREFAEAVKHRDLDAVYETLKSLNMRNHRKQAKWRYPSPAELPRDMLHSQGKIFPAARKNKRLDGLERRSYDARYYALLHGWQTLEL